MKPMNIQHNNELVASLIEEPNKIKLVVFKYELYKFFDKYTGLYNYQPSNFPGTYYLKESRLVEAFNLIKSLLG